MTLSPFEFINLRALVFLANFSYFFPSKQPPNPTGLAALVRRCCICQIILS